MGKDRPADPVLAQPAQLRAYGRMADQDAALVPPHERALQRRAVADVEVRAAERRFGILERDDVTGIDDRPTAGLDAPGDARAADGMDHRVRGDAKWPGLRRHARLQGDALPDRQVLRDLVRD